MTKFTIANTKGDVGRGKPRSRIGAKGSGQARLLTTVRGGIVESLQSDMLDLSERPKTAVNSEDWNSNRTNQACDRGYCAGQWCGYDRRVRW